MNVRKASELDMAAIYELGKAVEEFSVNDETVNFWPIEVLKRAANSDDVVFLLAEDEGPLGFIIVNYNQGLGKALIENMYVHPDARGRGAGGKLLHEAVKLLREKGCEYVTTLVPPHAQAAAELYKQNGFVQGEQFVWLDRSLNQTFKK